MGQNFEQELIYQIFPNSFNDGLQTGSGNLKGITNKIDYLKWLGVDRIWISPFTKSPFKDSGYDVANYYEVDQQFGTIADFKELIKTAKTAKISLIMDLVFNHTSNQHEWFQKALTGDEKYMNYYIFRDPVNGGEPTNWKSKMGGSCWEFVPSLNKYYLHLFAKEQPDLNWKNLEVRQEILQIINYWMDLGVAGFRLDVCNLYDKPEIFINDEIGDGRRFYTDGKLISSYFNLMYEQAFIKNKDCFTVGEVSSTTKEVSVNYAQKNGRELSSIFTFLHLKVDYQNNYKWSLMNPDLKAYWNIIQEWQTYYQQHNGLLALFMNNHDQPRSVSRFGDDVNYHYQSATSQAIFTHLLKGVSVLYQGEEIGMTNYPFKKLGDFWDVETIGNLTELIDQGMDQQLALQIGQTKARDNARTVMQWNDQINAGFSDAINIKIKVNPNYQQINVANQINDPHSVLTMYQQIFKLKKQHLALSRGAIEFLENNTLFSYKRTDQNQEFLIISNWTAHKVPNIIDLTNYQVVLNNYESFNPNLMNEYQTIVLERTLNEK